MVKYCEYPNCEKRALYGVLRSCPVRCKLHSENMQLVSLICEYPNCGKRALYGESRSCPLRCRIHRNNMQLVSSSCECGLGEPLFNYDDQIVGICCELCKYDDMVNIIIIKRCKGYVRDGILVNCPYDNVSTARCNDQCIQCFSYSSHESG
jgi:hypothetical protein